MALLGPINFNALYKGKFGNRTSFGMQNQLPQSSNINWLVT
uniref:Uncharacterized protein n=1 Tax=Arundo donax TaxID=35708 RepID=A0A0A9H8F7_ARUDO